MVLLIFLFLFFSAELIDFLCLAKVICIGYKLMAASCIFIVLLFLLAFILLVYVRPCPFIFISFWVNVVHVEPLKISIGAIVAIMFFFFRCWTKEIHIKLHTAVANVKWRAYIKISGCFFTHIDRSLNGSCSSKQSNAAHWMNTHRSKAERQRTTTMEILIWNADDHKEMIK